MPLDWLNTPLDADLGELIARKKKNRVIQALRDQVQGRVAPSVNVRLQLADLLIQAGRGTEAVPVLIGLAQEFAQDGFVAKAIAILKRVERVDPGRPDVQERLERLVMEQRRAAAGLPPPRYTSSVPELGIEEFRDEPVEIPSSVLAPVDAPGEPVPELEPEALTPEPEPPAAQEPLDAPPVLAEREAESDPLSSVLEMAEQQTEVVEIDEGEAATVLPLEPPPGETPGGGAPAAGSRVAGRIRRALRRFLSTLPGADDDASPPKSPEPSTAAPAEPEIETTEPEVEPEFEPDAVVASEVDVGPTRDPELIVEAEPEVTAAAEPEPGPDPEPEITADPEPEVTADVEPLSDAAFQEQLLDIVEDVLRAPKSGPAPERRVALPGREQMVDLTHRLLASRLLRDLAEDELLAVVQGLRLHTLSPGDVVVSEGEPGQGLFLVTTGRLKVFVANPDGRNFEVAMLGEGEFFGEISSLSGRPRTATVVAADACELLELDRPTLDGIARTHPRVREVLETSYIDRASSPEVAAVRAVTLPDEDSRRKAIEVLEAHFGESRWDPRMRLRLAELLLRAGKDRDAVDILVGLADDLAREGFPDKAIAILKKVETVQKRNVEVVNLAPLAGRPPAAPRPGRRARRLRATPAAAAATRRRPLTDDRLHGWLVELVKDTVVPAAPQGDLPAAARGSLRAYGPGLVANPLFEGFDDDELVALIGGLRLLSFDAGDIVVTEGEQGQSVFILTTGRVKVFVRGPDRRNVPVGVLGEGTFFGEISTLSGDPRSATVVAAESCEMLELDRPALDRIAQAHPRVRTVLEEYSAARTADPDARRARHGASESDRSSSS